MNTHVNERIGAGAVTGAKSTMGSRPPELISATAKELLNVRRLPAMLNTAQTAALIGLAEHDIGMNCRPSAFPARPSNANARAHADASSSGG